MKFHLGRFLEAATAAAAGSMAGRLQGEQEGMQQQEQSFLRAQALLGQQQEFQAGQDRLLMSQLGNLEPASQATALQGMASRPNPMLALGQHPYAQRTGLASLFPPQAPQTPQAPGVVPASLEAGAAGRTFQAPGIGALTLKGVDPKQVAKTQGEVDKLISGLQNSRVTTPEQAAYRDHLIGRRNQFGTINSPEQYDQLVSFQTALGQFASQVGGPQAQRLGKAELDSDTKLFEEEIERDMAGLDDLSFAQALVGHLKTERSIRDRRKERGYGGKGLEASEADIAEIQRLMDAGDTEGVSEKGRLIRGRINAKKNPAQEQQGFARAMAIIKEIDPEARTPELVRGIFQKAEVGHLVEGLPNEALQLGGRYARDQYNKAVGMLSDSAKWAKLPKSVQSTLLGIVQDYSKAAGEKLTLPAEIVLQMTPLEQAKLGFEKDRIDLQGRKLDIAYANMKLRERQINLAASKWERERNDKAAKGGKPNDLSINKAWQSHRDNWKEAWDKYESQATAAKYRPGDFDLMKPNPGVDEEVKLSEAYKQAIYAGEQYEKFLKDHGITIHLNDIPGAGNARQQTQVFINEVQGKNKPISAMTNEELAAHFARAAAKRLKGGK